MMPRYSRPVDAGLEVGKWIGEAVASVLVGGAASWLMAIRTTRVKQEKLEGRVARLASLVDELEAKISEVERAREDARVQSSADHANAANLAAQVVEVKAMAANTHTVMQRILGLLQGKGIGGPFG